MKFLKKIIAYPLSIIYYLFFGSTLLIFQPIQWIANNIFGYKAHKKVVDVFNGCLVSCLYILGTRITFINKQSIPDGVPLIIVSNHQGLYDISPLSWFFRKYHPKFVSKKELGKGLPSISYNLRHGGSVLIDRKNPKQAISALINFGKYLENSKYSAIIFPEGTRSRTGIPKKFSSNGLKTLVKFIPSAYIVPVTINNSYKLLENGTFPLALGTHLTFEVHKPIEVKSNSFENLFKKTEQTIKNAVILYA
ncbi:MAG: 1-acyl-sn-glycerol-3-phosphate acyltransferase [Lutibacter sp.]|nr:MAG: 1-acyl-sn-glycerol-3-phosphate acyltransferase [Lutibacter sp.]